MVTLLVFFISIVMALHPSLAHQRFEVIVSLAIVMAAAGAKTEHALEALA